jgi:hypothetical protein
VVRDLVAQQSARAFLNFDFDLTCIARLPFCARSALGPWCSFGSQPMYALHPAAQDDGTTDRILAYLIKTAPNTPRVAPTAGDGTAADLAAMALSTALLLADQKHAHRPRSPQAEWSPRVARGHAGKPGKLTTLQPTARALPPLRSPQLAPRPKPTTVVYAALRQQISDRAVRHCDPRFNSWADVDIPPLSPRRARAAVSNDLEEPGPGFYAESIRKSPRARK